MAVKQNAFSNKRNEGIIRGILKSVKPMYLWLASIFLSVCTTGIGQPICKVDLNVPDRHEQEVNEPGYTPWPVNKENPVDSIVVNGIQFKLNGKYAVGWYKAGVQSPYNARLANDGIQSGLGVQLVISGLPKGNHTLLTFHNTFTNLYGSTLSPIDVYVGGNLAIGNYAQTNRVSNNAHASAAYFNFEVDQGEDVVFLFRPETNTQAEIVLAALCGFELNTPNSNYQATLPIPKNNDEHANADNDSLCLRWKAASKAISHYLYVGVDFASVSGANPSSASFMQNQTDTFYLLTGLYSRTKYYWRVDEHDQAGKITKGDIWSFRPRQLAFPNAEGYGKYALGGRGGKVVEVTNLNDHGPGSLREAIADNIGPCTIVFAVSGLIELESRLTLKDECITVAGQTAPGKGICIRRAPFGMSGANDCVVRHMRVRVGSGKTYDGMGMSGSDHCIIDHCSVSWAIDEAFSSRNAKNITLQRTLISEALNVAGHSNYPYGKEHGYAASISGDIGSFHHNLLAHCAGRNWSLAGGLDGNGVYAGRLDIFNNVVYNWRSRVTDGGAHEVNFVNNYYKKGPASQRDYALNAQYDNFPGTQQYYFAGNIMPGEFDESNQEAGRIYSGTPNGYSPWVDEPFFESMAEIHPVRQAYKNVLTDVGCTQPVFDNHDVRITQETLDGTYTYRGSKTGYPGIPDAHSDVGGWENYPQKQRSKKWDTDHDGLPNWWEDYHGSNPNSDPGDFSDSNADLDGDGYTNLDDYLNWMALPHLFTTMDSALLIDIQSLFKGYANKPEYSILGTENGEAEIIDGKIAQFTPKNEGFGSLKLKVKDGVGDTLSRTIGIFVGEIPADTIYCEGVQTTNVANLDKSQIEKESFGIYGYPNPVNEALFLCFETDMPIMAKIQIIDMMGALVLEENRHVRANKDLVEIGFGSINPGVYNLIIRTKTSQKVLRVLKK